MIKSIKIIGLFATLFLIAAPGYTQPQITGVKKSMHDSQEVIINGSNFGLNDVPAPILEDGFESGSDGELLQTGAWIAAGSENEGRYSTDNPRTGSQSARWHFTKQEDGESEYYHKFQEINGERKLYATFWQHIEGLHNRGMKSLRLTHGDPYYGKLSMAVRSYLAYADPQGRFSGIARGSENIDTKEDYMGASNLPHGQWHRIEMFFDVGDPNQPNGNAIFGAVGYNSETVENLIFRDDESQLLDTIFIGQGIPGGDNYKNGYYYMDDLYVSNTQARVEIGNASNFAACTHREIQTIRTWADNEIKININQGTFQDYEDIYMFVVDGNGDISTGYAITFEDAKEELQPPQNISLQSKN